MNIQKMLASLIAQREKLDRLIVAAEDYARGAGKKRGRPPKWMAQQKRRGRPPGSPNKKPAASKTAQGD